jgi:hypothetical protein
MGSKTFRVAVASEEISFVLEYVYKGKPAKREFHCRRSVPTGLILEFASVGDPNSDAGSSGLRAMTLINDLYEKAIVEEEYPLFKALLDDPDAEFDINTYSEIAGWLAGEYTGGRPIGENSDKSSPGSPSGTALTAGVSDTELTYFRPEPVAATQ